MVVKLGAKDGYGKEVQNTVTDTDKGVLGVLGILTRPQDHVGYTYMKQNIFALKQISFLFRSV